MTTNNSQNTYIIAPTTHEVTMPAQPAFMASPNATSTNETGDGTVFTLDADTEIYDQNSDYNVGTYTFTSPVTGRYWFDFGGIVNNLIAAHTKYIQTFVTSNASYETIRTDAGSICSSQLCLCGVILADMDAADTCYVTVAVYNSTKTVGFYGSGTVEGRYLRFSGFLAT